MKVQQVFCALKIPLRVVTLLSGAKDFAGNPLLGSAVLNTLGLHIARKKLAHSMCQLRRWFMRRNVPDAQASTFQANGFVLLENFLSTTDFEQLRHEVVHLQHEAIEMVQAPATTRRFNLDATGCVGRPALLSLLKNRRLLGLLRYAAGYGGDPIIAVQCIHTDACGPDDHHDPQTDWHADTFHSTAKAWLFLHDVRADEGPFAYVPESHQLSASRLAWEKAQSITAAHHPNRLHAKGSFRATPGELAQLGYGEPVLGVVPANTLVVADTSGFHRRTPSEQASVRVEIYLSLRRNPFFAGLYPSLLGLPWIRRRWAGMALDLYRWQVERGKPSWRPCNTLGLSEVERGKLQG